MTGVEVRKSGEEGEEREERKKSGEDEVEPCVCIRVCVVAVVVVSV